MTLFKKIKHTFVICVVICTTSLRLSAATETISSGSFIINMGITPQTVANGLKPYGLVYDLIKNYNVPIKWVIKTSKIKDGIDFSHNGIDYKGGPFIIPASYRTAAVNARITFWQGQGVIGATTVSSISVEVFTTLKSMPVWTLDDQNGSIAQGYLTNAGIPATAYNFLAPAVLTCCNDIFVMPHADPKWSTHANLFDWNLNCDGAIWLACHAGSAEEDLFNPANKPIQMNFLSNKTGNATGAGPYEENALVLWGNHADGSPPYNYAYPTDPIMQFMGILDAATQNGSEQIYLPKTGWRAGAKVYVWDPTHADVPSKSPGPAAVIVSGRAFDDPLRGRVMMEAAHSHNKGTAPENIAAQRAFLNFSYWSMNEKAVIPSISAGAVDTMYSGVPYSFSFTLPPGYSAGSFTIAWTASCGGTFSPSNAQSTTYTPPPAAFPTNCIIKVTITDACGRVFVDTKSIVMGCKMQVAAAAVSPSCFGGTNGSVNLTITNATGPYTWNWSRVSPVGTGTGSGTTISPLTIGTYNITVTTSSGCTQTASVSVTQPPLLVATPTVSNVLCNGASTGSISLSVVGGTPAYTFNWGGGITTQNRSNIAAGTYNVTVTDSKGCTATAVATVSQPSAITITSSITNVNCFGGNTGAVNITVSGGTGTKTYSWSNGATTEDISSVAAGTYIVTVTDANGCTKTSSSTVTEPSAALSLTATMVNVSCTGGSNGSIDLTVTGGTTTYTYLWSNGATTQDLSGLTAGTYTVTVTDSKSCTAVLSKAITQQSTMVLSFTKINATCPGSTDGSIDLSVSGGTPTYTYLWSNGATTQDISGLAAGNYTVTVTDSNGCTSNTSVTITNIKALPPAPPAINN